MVAQETINRIDTVHNMYSTILYYNFQTPNSCTQQTHPSSILLHRLRLINSRNPRSMRRGRIILFHRPHILRRIPWNPYIPIPFQMQLYILHLQHLPPPMSGNLARLLQHAINEFISDFHKQFLDVGFETFVGVNGLYEVLEFAFGE